MATRRYYIILYESNDHHDVVLIVLEYVLYCIAYVLLQKCDAYAYYNIYIIYLGGCRKRKLGYYLKKKTIPTILKIKMNGFALW